MENNYLIKLTRYTDSIILTKCEPSKDIKNNCSSPVNIKENINSNMLHICNFEGYEISGKLFQMNYTVVENGRVGDIVTYYFSIQYEKMFITGQLTNLVVVFKPCDNAMVTSDNSIKLRGSFIIKIYTDNEQLQCDLLNSLNETDETCSISLSFEQYKGKENIVELIKKICNTPSFINVLTRVVSERNTKRTQDAKSSFEYKEPRRVFNLAELKCNPSKIDDMLSSPTSSSSSSTTSSF